jgi:hypothetical protein
VELAGDRVRAGYDPTLALAYLQLEQAPGEPAMRAVIFIGEVARPTATFLAPDLSEVDRARATAKAVFERPRAIVSRGAR